MKTSESPSPTAAPPDVLARLGDVDAVLAGLAGELVPERLPGHLLERVMTVLSRIEQRAGGARLVLAKTAADVGAWRAAGARSPAEHLAKQSGVTLGEAKADLAASERLAALPRAREAAASGALSKGASRAVAEAATADPSCEGALLATAGEGDLGAVRDHARRVCTRVDEQSGAAARRRYQRRALRSWVEIDGEGRGSWNVPMEYQAVWLAAFEPYRREAFRLAHAAGTRPTHEALMADAMQMLCLDVLADHDLDAPPGAFDPACPDGPCAGTSEPDPVPEANDNCNDSAGPPAGATVDEGTLFSGPGPAAASDVPRPGASPPRAEAADTPARTHPRDEGPPPTDHHAHAIKGAATGRPPTRPSERRFAERRRAGGNRRAPAQVIVHADHAALIRGHTLDGEMCEIPGVGPVPVSYARQLATDALLVVLLTKGADVAAIATERRYIPAPLRAAVIARDRHCVVPGCTARHHLEIHHWRLDFAKGGSTYRDNLAAVCGAHHRLITHCRWTLTGGPGHWTFQPP